VSSITDAVVGVKGKYWKLMVMRLLYEFVQLEELTVGVNSIGCDAK
jgi:hypothetical protein